MKQELGDSIGTDYRAITHSSKFVYLNKTVMKMKPDKTGKHSGIRF